MIEPNFNLGNYIKLISGKKLSDKQMIEFNGRVIYPAEISKIVLLFLLIEDDKWKKPRFEQRTKTATRNTTSSRRSGVCS